MVMTGAIATEGYLRMKLLSPALMGYFHVRPSLRTEKGCFFIDHANPNVIMDQADVYMSALVQGERYRVAGDRLEILDGEGATRLVFDREAPLPGDNPSTCAAPRGVSLRTTTWTMTNV